MSTLIGPQEKPHIEDIGGAGEPIGDLLALINSELFHKERIVFVLDGTLFTWKEKGQVYRVNEELVFRPHEISTRLQNRDLEALAARTCLRPSGTARPRLDDPAWHGRWRGSGD